MSSVNAQSQARFNPIALVRNVARQVTNTATQVAAQASTQIQDASSVTGTGPKNNPFQGMGAQASSVTVQPWKSGGDNSNSTLSGILLGQGYSQDELFAKDANGSSLIDKVAAANDLRDPNLIRINQKLIVPTKPESASGAAGTSAPAASPESQSNGNSGNIVSRLANRFLGGNGNSSSEASETRATPTKSTRRMSREDVNATLATSPFQGTIIGDDGKFDRSAIRDLSRTGRVSDKDLAEMVSNGKFETLDEARAGATKFGQAVSQFSGDKVALNSLEQLISTRRHATTGHSGEYRRGFNADDVSTARNIASSETRLNLETVMANPSAIDSLKGSAHKGSESGNGFSQGDLRNADRLLQSETYRVWVNSGAEGSGFGGTKSDMLKDFLGHVPMTDDEIGNPQAYRQRVHGILSAASSISKDDSAMSFLNKMETSRNGVHSTIRVNDLQSIFG